MLGLGLRFIIAILRTWNYYSATAENLRIWLSANKQNSEKQNSEPMLASIADTLPNIFIDSKPIKQINECKTLGVVLGQHLSWKSNTYYICKRITSGIFALRLTR